MLSLPSSTAHCSPDLSTTLCYNCLDEAIGDIKHFCDGKIGGILMGPSCTIRFEVYRFYDPSAAVQLAPLASPPVSPPRPATNTTEPPPSHEGKSSSTTRIMIIAVVSGVALFILLISIFCFCQRNQRKPSQNVESEDYRGVEKLERKDSAEYHRSSTGLWANIRDTEMHSCRTAVRPGECNGQTNYGFSGDDAQ
ncbi:hypothetical protein SAY87_022866 [Trapa incisa]|uniref:Gnk2-homologous domain-containing protein n=1 Tax=Trapa incisa TaxID=236973 RepID=A0AAN7K3A9_9MYRT|nr:hypothetical protein SAY87_022866 [Trapa incisa]